ncbi:MAG: tetratricopeptide repeat protein, partial [Acidobacteriota bacterium]
LAVFVRREALAERRLFVGRDGDLYRRLRGTVTDGESNALPSVQVTVTSDEQTSFRKSLSTDEDGEFVLRFTRNQAQYTFKFLFEKPGYQSFTQNISPSTTRLIRETFVMDVSETQAVERHGDLQSVVTGSSNAAVEAFNAGLAAQLERNLEVARTKFEEALSADPDLGPAQVALSQVRLDLQDYAGALSAADGALAGENPGRVDALRVKYQALRALGRQDEAEAVSAELESAEDAVAAARRVYNEGGEAFKVDDRATALEKFRRAAELDPTLVDAHHAVATLELAAGNHEAAATSAEKALSLGSDKLETLRVLYDAYESLGRLDQLTEIAPRLAAVDPDFGGAKLVEQAAELWNAGQTAQAVALARQALAIDPSIAKAYYFLGLDHLSGGRSAEAKSALEKFISLAPEDPVAGTAQEMLSYIN